MKEALKLALEALTIQSDRVTEIGKQREAITAIKAALAQPTSGDYALGYVEGFNDACKPKPAQEPTGMLHIDRLDKWLDASLKERKSQRTWVGLDEKDFSAINQSCLTKLQAATSAESILKEKNT